MKTDAHFLCSVHWFLCLNIHSYTPRTLRPCCSQSKFRILKIRESSARTLFLYNCTPNISSSADASVSVSYSGVARAFPGGRAAHPEDQNEEENEEKLRKNERSYRKMRKDWGNHPIFPAREWEASYGPGHVGLIYASIGLIYFLNG